MNLFDMFESGKKQDIEEACWKGHHKEGMKTMFGKEYPNCKKNKNESLETYINKEECPGCGGNMVSEEQFNEKQDACYHKVKSRYKVWPSAYASGALVQCRKKGADNWGNKNESITQEEYDQLDENLKQWFSDKWVRFGPDGKIRGDCARGDSNEGKPKCLPQSKAQSLGKKGRASAAARKRREDPNPERSGKAINVATKKESVEGVAEGSNQLVPYKESPLDLSSDYAYYIVGKGNSLLNTFKKLFAKANTLPPEQRDKFYDNLSNTAANGDLGDTILHYSKTINIDDLHAIDDVFDAYDLMFHGIAFPDDFKDYEAAWKQYASDVVLARTHQRPGQTMHEQGVAEGLAQDEAEEDSGWRAEFVNEINYNTFEVKLTNTRSKESANFIVRPVDMVSYGPTLSIETMDVHDLQTGQTESWTNDDPAPDGPIAYAISGLFYDDKQLQKKLQNIIDTHDTKGQDMMPGLEKRRSIGQEVDADAYIDSQEKTQAAMAKMKKGVAEGSESDAYGNTGEKHECGSCDGTGIDTHDDECPECGGKGWVRDKESSKKKGVAEGVPQPGKSSGKPISWISPERVITKYLTLNEILNSVQGIPYYNEVVKDRDTKDFTWGVTKKVLEYARELIIRPDAYKNWPPIIVVDGKLQDGAHRISTINLMQKRVQPNNPIWKNAKLKVEFGESDNVRQGVAETMATFSAKASTGNSGSGEFRGVSIPSDMKHPEWREPTWSFQEIAQKLGIPVSALNLIAFNRIGGFPEALPGLSARHGSKKYYKQSEVKRWVNANNVREKLKQGVAEDRVNEKWTQKYKSSINCSNPKGFSQKAHCAGEKKNEDMAEGKEYYTVMGTDSASLRRDFNMTKDRNGWYLREGSTSKQKLDVYRAFGSPKLKEFNLAAFSGGTQTKGEDNIISPVGSQTRAQYKK